MTDALELAVGLARHAERLDPPLDVPRSVAPFVQFATLPARARAVVRRALDEHGEFRQRVADAAPSAGLSPAALLFLTRPEGWEEELRALAATQAEQVASETEGRVERQTRRRLEGAEAARRRAEARVGELTARLARAEDDLRAERKSRRAVEAALAEARRDAEAAGQRAVAAEERRASAEADLDGLRTAVRDLEGRLAGAGPRAQAMDETAAADAAGAIDGAAELVREAGRGVLAALESAREAIDRLIEPAGGAGAASPRVAPPHAGESRRDRVRASPRRRRLPVGLPPGIMEDSTEAAEFLARQRGVELLVDGYNATLSVWSQLPIEEQRTRLVDAAAELTARTGASVHVVFDGAEGGAIPSLLRRRVRVTFSPSGVEADDVLLETVESVDPGRPVVVASSDLRVRDGARERGANTISTRQLLALLRRDPG